MANPIIRRKWHLGADNRELQDEHRTGQRPYIQDRLYEQIVEFGDFTAAAVTEALSMNLAFTGNAFPAGVHVKYGWIELYELWAGGSIATAVMELGDAGNDDELLAAVDVFTGASLGIKHGLSLQTQEATYVPLITLTTTTDDVNAAITGRAGIFIVHSEIPNLAEGQVRN